MPAVQATSFSPATDTTGARISGALRYFYEVGTTDPVTTYSDLEQTTAQAHPVVADADGVFPEIYVSAGRYRQVLKTSAGVTVLDVDNFEVDYGAESVNDALQDLGGVLTTGTSTAYVAVSARTLTALADSDFVVVKLHAANGIAPTLNLNGFGAKAIKIRGATGLLIAAPSGRFTAGDIVQLSYSLSDDAFIAPYLNQSFSPVVGQCRFSYTSATACTLMPQDGASVPIAGVSHEIPSAGVALANTGLAISTAFNVFAYNDSGTVTLEASTTATAIDTTAGNVGVQIKAGDATRTFVGRVYVSASGEFTAEQVESHFNPLARPRRLHFRHEAASGTGSGGGTSSSGVWMQRPLNTEKTNEIIGATVTSNVVTLPAGDYRVKARANLYKTGESKIRLYDNDASASIIDGEQLWIDTGSSGNAFLQVSGNFTLSAETDIELQTRGTGGIANNGMGRVTGAGVEVYSIVEIEELT